MTDQRIYTAANAPSTPTVAASATSSLLTTIDQNSNPSNTTYAILVGTQYVQADGSLGLSEAWQSYSSWGGSSGVTVTGLSPNAQYTVSVKARNGDSDESSFSTSSSKYTYANPVTSVSLADATSASAYGLTLTWTDASQSGVKIDLSSVGGGGICDDTYDVGDYDNATVNATSPRSVSASANTCYKARIGSYNGDGVLNTSDYATTSTGVTTPPAQATGLTLSSADATQLVWDWADVTGATNYKIYRSSDDALIGQSASSTYSQTTVTDGGVAVSPNTQYTVYVRVANTNGTGISSSTASGYTYASTPTSLSHDSASQTIDTMKWTWVSGGAQGGFYANMLSPVANSSWITDLFWTVSSVLSSNTQYTFYVKARNSESTETTTSSASAYTSQGVPTGITFSDVAANSITVTATGTFANLTTGSSGVRFQNSTTAADNTLQVTGWTNSSLSPNTEYTYVLSAFNGDGDETTSVTASEYTLANTPGGVTVDNPATTTLDILINVNANPSATQFAIHETGTDQYVQTNGTLGAVAVWQTVGMSSSTEWGYQLSESGKVRVAGLSLDTSYEFEVKARNGDNTETAYGTSSSVYTTVAAGSTPTVDSATSSTLDVTINAGSNPSTTTYKIYESTTGFYVQVDGSLDSSAVWQTAAAWGTVSGVTGKITVIG